MAPDEANPFQRGTGSYPPVLAGRRAELSALNRLLNGLANGTLEQTIHLLQAPRGLGKTVLLQALERDATVSVDTVDVLRISAGDLPSFDHLAQLIEPARALPRRILDWFAGASAFGVRLQRPNTAGPPRSVALALERRSHRALLLSVDEAHVLPPDACRMLLNAFQNVAGKGRCALLLAGTPALRPLLLSQEVNASFAERAPAIQPGLLSLEESVEALRVPQWEDWEVDNAVLEEVAADCLGYPFFLQLWGEHLWEAGRPQRVVDRQAIDAARGGVDAVRADFYAARFDEFERFGREQGVDRVALLAAVQRIAPQVSARNAVITTRSLNHAMEESGLSEIQAAAARMCFIDNGFLTRSGDDWRAAIPSLATYIREHPR